MWRYPAHTSSAADDEDAEPWRTQPIHLLLGPW
jgi:hypothetical protein